MGNPRHTSDPYNLVDDKDQIFGQRSTECKFCGETPLWWVQTERGWRMFDDHNNQHFCDEYKEAVEARRDQELRGRGQVKGAKKEPSE